MPTHAYRADIDGLRAVAILGVLAFHFGLGGVTGGYGGVDVFFVISGFLIAGIIRGELEAGTFSLAQFYARRIRRILPALVVCLLATTIAATVIFFPHDLVTYGRSLQSVATGTSNFYFAKKAGDYFGGVAAEMPLLHTWSLSIEEQFYAVFPLVIMLLFRFRRSFVTSVMAIAVVASLAYSVSAVSHAPAQAFFSSAGRVWELLCGTMLAFGLLPQVRNGIVREAEAFIGAAIICWCYFSYTASTPFPGLAAVPLCLGAVLIIHSGIGSERDTDLPKTIIARLLASSPGVALGKISYSVYLWHWPLLALARYRYPQTFAGELKPEVGLAFCVVSLALGTLSWRFIERPFRGLPVSERRWQAYAGGLIVLTILLGGTRLLIQAPHSVQTWPPEIVELGGVIERNRKPASFELPPSEQGWPVETHIIGSGRGAETGDALLWGDSHALAIIPGLQAYVEKAGKRVVVSAHPGCPPLIDVIFSGNRFENVCQGLNDRTLAAVLNSKIKRVLLVGRWAFFPDKMYFENGKATYRRGQRGSDAFAPALEATVKTLVEHGKEVVIMGPVPEFEFNVISVAERHLAWGMALPEEQTLQTFLDRERRLLPILARLDQADGVDVIYPHLRLCEAGRCRYLKDGVPLYSDDNHLTAAGARELSNMYAEFFRSNQGVTTASP
ncbi:acyltransferase family protein [Hyphomicrobium sp. 99]|uniref:acyltransferase family protein n=1 Tax=Hyphomicrobium sp. 99 TaxID=1163419 RepID=UPI0018CD778F|nr:acyltransferase family protein [Hyphomicrobium sp. 99]